MKKGEKSTFIFEPILENDPLRNVCIWCGDRYEPVTKAFGRQQYHCHRCAPLDFDDEKLRQLHLVANKEKSRGRRQHMQKSMCRYCGWVIYAQTRLDYCCKRHRLLQERKDAIMEAPKVKNNVGVTGEKAKEAPSRSAPPAPTVPAAKVPTIKEAVEGPLAKSKMRYDRPDSARKLARVEKICTICSATFSYPKLPPDAKKTRRPLICEKCAKKAGLSLHIYESRKCINCGGEFVPFRSDTKFCSDKCRHSPLPGTRRYVRRASPVAATRPSVVKVGDGPNIVLSLDSVVKHVGPASPGELLDTILDTLGSLDGGKYRFFICKES